MRAALSRASRRSRFSELFLVALFRNLGHSTAFENKAAGMQVGCATMFTVLLRLKPAEMCAFPASAGTILTPARSLARIVSTVLRWRARRDDGEHSGRVM